MSRKFVGLSGIMMCAQHWVTQSLGWAQPCVPPKHPCGGSESCAAEHLHSQARTAPTNEVFRTFVFSTTCQQSTSSKALRRRMDLRSNSKTFMTSTDHDGRF